MEVVYIFVFSTKIKIRIAMSFSLKDKRQVVRRIKDRVMATFKVPLVEVEEMDTLNFAVLGYSIVGQDLRRGRQLQEKIEEFIADNCQEEVVDVEHFEEKY